MGLRVRIFVFVVVASSLINLFLCFYITRQVKIHELENLRVQIDKSTYAIRSINTLPLFNVDREVLKSNMEAFFDDENVKSLTLQDLETNINIHLERRFPFEGTDIKKSFVIDHNGLKLGKLTVVYSTSLIEKKLAGFRTRMLWVTFCVILVMAVMIAFIIKLINKPVARFIRNVSEIASGNLDKEIEQVSSKGMGKLSDNFAIMRDAVKEKREDLARTSKMLKSEVQNKKIQEKKILHQDMVIASVGTFFQRSMAARTIEEIAEIFIPIVLTVVPGPYCFIGQVCDKKNYLNILALSDQAEKQSSMFDNESMTNGYMLHISDRLARAISDKTSVISNNVSENSEFSFLISKDYHIDTLMAFPMLYGKDVLGLAVFAGKQGDYTLDDQEAATTMIIALVEALTLKILQNEKKRLEKTLIQAEKVKLAKGLAAGMANEINKPLDRIQQAVQMIRSSIDNPDSKKTENAEKNGLDFDALDQYMREQGVFNNLDQIITAGEKASRIVANILFLSGKTQTDFAVEDISLLLDQALELASIEHGVENGINFSAIQIMKDYDPDLPKIKCRGRELKQAFFNILLNGAYAMVGNTDNPYPTFFMRTHGKEDYVCVEIRDNGPGIPESIIKDIFEPLFTTKTDKEGKGLGLSVSRLIITQDHNGTIDVESAPGEGSCFRILLPVQ